MGKSNARAAPAQAITATAALTEHANAIRQLGKRIATDVIEIGRRLVDCRDHHLEHGQWLPWLEKEFGWSDQTARNFIKVFEQSKSQKFLNLDLPVSSLYLLAAPSTPKKARKEIAKLAKGGKRIKHDVVNKVVKKHKAAKKSAGKGKADKTEGALIALEWKRGWRGTCARTSGGTYEVYKINIDPWRRCPMRPGCR